MIEIDYIDFRVTSLSVNEDHNLQVNLAEGERLWHNQATKCFKDYTPTKEDIEYWKERFLPPLRIGQDSPKQGDYFTDSETDELEAEGNAGRPIAIVTTESLDT